MLIEGKEVRTAGVSDDLPCQVDAIQLETGEGPCLEAMEEHQVFEIGDMRVETRWPEFARRAAAETPVRSMLSFRLFDEKRTVGALNLFAKDLKAFDESDHQVGGVFAAYAALALTNAREVEGLRLGLETRTVIATAKGMLMAREGVSDEEAFSILRRASQRMNVKLRDVAQKVVEGSVSTPEVAGEAGTAVDG
jgi:GAF domain-containing protein